MNSAKKYSVLAIDDQLNWRELLVDLLADEFEVKSADGYDSALEIIRDQVPPFHVVVTDMRLEDEEVGNEDGLKLIEFLNKRGDETNTIVVTGYATLDTAKRALSALNAYDYLEKRPSDGSLFNIAEFRSVVYRAAEEAEEKRPKGFTDISYDILVLEPNLEWRSKLENISRKEGYRVTAVESVEMIERFPNAIGKDYVLILVSESLANGDVFEKLQRLFPKGKIIIITSYDISNIMDAMREYPVITAIAMPNGELNDNSIRDAIHGALANGSRKYVFAQISDPDHPEQPVAKGIVGQTYHINLSIQDNPSGNTVGVYLAPQGNKRGRAVKLHLYAHAKGLKVGPEVERYWDIPFSTERPKPCNFLVTPGKIGQSDILIEIDQDNRFLGRIQIKFDVTS